MSPHGIVASSTSLIHRSNLAKAAAEGGTETESGGWKIHTFTSTGNSNFIVNRALTGVQILIVAGGGGGGGDNSGGGGAGGLVYYGTETPTNRTTPNGGNQSFSIGTYVVTVGAGGSGAPAVNTDAQSGGLSRVNGPSFDKQANGGGRGGTGDGTPGRVNGLDGGSGGGAAQESGNTGNKGFTEGNVGNAPQGNHGGAGSNGAGGGGGGAGAAGQDGNVRGSQLGGNGGIGLQYSISGSATWYAAGGSGGNENDTYNQPSRASGIGGQSNTASNTSATDGIDGTGSGGGGITHDGIVSGNYGGDGGDGIVIIRYQE